MFRCLILILLLIASPALAHAQQDSLSKHYKIDDIVVTSRQQAISTPDVHGNLSLNIGALSDMPRIAGAVDVIKLLQYTPGVAAVEEGNSAMLVRGGDIGQSITLLNDAPIYSPSHLFGIFSAFNSAHLSGMTLYKSGIPSMYGSSSASVLAIRTHRYIPEKTHITANIGLIESDAALQLPIGEKFALFASARRSYVSWLTKIISQNKSDIYYNFGDYGLGFVADLGRAGKLIMNSHFNNDTMRANILMYNSIGRINWWNALATLSLETPISNKVSLTNTIYSSLYNNTLKLGITSSNINVYSGVQDYGIKSMAQINLNRIEINSGINYSFRRILPQSIDALSNDLSQRTLFDPSHEVALFANTEWQVNNHLEIDAGLRFSIYNNNEHTWYYPEPRIMFSIPVTHTLHLWANYNMLTQYIQLVPQSNLSFATDYYIGTAQNIPPQLSHNFSIGYSDSAFNGSLHWSAEIYYRYMNNALEYTSNILDFINGNKHDDVKFHHGKGEAYGLETSIGYNRKGFDIQFNYTLSKSLRQFESLNQGMAFPAHSDRRHTLSFMTSYKISPRWSVSSSFVYASGAPYTTTKGLHIGGNAIVKEVGLYNGARLPDLHHLDLSVTYWLKCRRLEYSGINFSIYNVYAHKNPTILSWDITKDDDNVIHLNERYHELYTILPSISWTVKF